MNQTGSLTMPPPRWKVGDRVIVLGSPGRPEDVRTVTAVNQWTLVVDPPYEGESVFPHGKIGPDPWAPRGQKSSAGTG